jgi:hypothetical protein
MTAEPYIDHDAAPHYRRSTDPAALAEELAQLTCSHLPWSDQRVITLELGVGECDLAIDDMVRGAVHFGVSGARPHHRAVARVARRV